MRYPALYLSKHHIGTDIVFCFGAQYKYMDTDIVQISLVVPTADAASTMLVCPCIRNWASFWAVTADVISTVLLGTNCTSVMVYTTRL